MTTQATDLAAYRARRAGVAEGWVRKPDVAEHFGVSLRTVERWLERDLPCRRVSTRPGRPARLVLLRISDCEAWLATHG